MKLSIIIVNYNVRHYLCQCLDSVRRSAEGLDVETWVVDNASTDDSVAMVRLLFPEVHVIENQDNVGFARANNQAIKASTSELVLLLNPDTFIAEDTLTHCIRFFEEHQQAGAIGIHMVNRDGTFARESRRGLPTPSTAFYKVIGLSRLFPRSPRFARYHMGHLPEFADGRIDAISGAFMMLRREALEQVGLLDETFFMYGEDIDLSYRIGQGGWECWYTPALMLHYKGESTQQTSFRYVYNFYNAMLIFFRKNFAKRYWFAWLFVELAVLTMGILSLLRKWLHRSLRFLKHITGISKLQKRKAPYIEKLLFIGSEEAWIALRPICDRANIQASRINTIEEKTEDATYICFEVTPTGRPYYQILWQLMANARTKHRSGIGTFNLQTKTLILPNDIYT